MPEYHAVPDPAEEHHCEQEPVEHLLGHTGSDPERNDTPPRSEFDRLLDACTRGASGSTVWPLTILIVFALVGASLHWLIPAWWPLGAVFVSADLLTAIAVRRWAGRGTRLKPPQWAPDAERHMAGLALRLPPHVVSATRDFRATVEASRWHWPGVYALSPDCTHRTPCTDRVCTGASSGIHGCRVLMLVGRHVLTDATQEQARAVLMHEAAHMRGWQPIAGQIQTALRLTVIIVVAWAVPTGRLAPALLALHVASILLRWTMEIGADLAASRSTDPRTAADYLEHHHRRLATHRRSILARVTGALMPSHPPHKIRARILRSRLARRMYSHGSGTRV